MSFPDPRPKALFFDVFGTCVDWRTTVTDALESACNQALARASSSITTQIRSRAEGLVCLLFPQKSLLRFLADLRSSLFFFSLSLSDEEILG